MKLVWKGKGINEKAFWKNKPIILIDKKYFRPTEVESLRGNFTLAKKELKWKPSITVQELVKEMVTDELTNKF
jgi:GDPmannose 4,6-dehydratase